MMPRCDFITVHAPLSAETEGLIGKEELALARTGLVVVNCARGGIVDEAALAEAIQSGRVAGAGIDVFTEEPPRDNPLLRLENVLATPHLGASTIEAQAGVAMEACQAVLAYLREGEIRGAVNVGGVDLRLDDYGKSLVDLACRMGAILSRLSRGPMRRLKVMVSGERAQTAATACTRMMLVELLRPHLAQRVNMVNAPQIARHRGLAVEMVQVPESQLRQDQIEAHLTCEAEHSIAGSVVYDGLPHVWHIDGYRMDMIPEGQMVMLFNEDKPGVIGVVGQVFGDAGVNIADMTISRRGDRAMMVIRIDGKAGDGLLRKLSASRPILWVNAVELPHLNRTDGM
jgi:D-3-phosphoglycerate dehydrogenase